MLVASGYSEAALLLAHFILHLIFLAPLMANRKFWHSFFIVIPILAVKEINESKQSIKYNFILYILIFLAPIISNFIWANYFKTTHNFFGRTEHSFSNLWVLIKSFSGQNQLLVLHYLKFLFKFLIQEGSLLILTLIGISWYAVRRRSQEYIQEYKFYFKSALVFFAFGDYIYISLLSLMLKQ
ncbi:hypothetical protein [Candidatus Trichorickettsia mobilis]|nr:hypothetical protein [Candidatus Trichorickettsia mobilis]